MDKSKNDLRYLLIIFVLLLLVLSTRSFLMAYIVEPAALLLWLGWRIAASVDQQTYWIILIVFCTLLVVRFISTGKDAPSNSAYNDTYRPPSRVEYWQSLLEESTPGKNKNEQLRNSLKELYASMPAHSGRIDSKSTGDLPVLGKPGLSNPASRYLFAADGNSEEGLGDSRLRRIILLHPWLRRWGANDLPQEYGMVDDVLDWIENELEINDGE